MKPPEADGRDDRAAVEGFVRLGSEADFRILYRRHTPRLYGLAWRMLGANAADVSDVVQETWLRAAQGLAEFEWRSSLSTWLCGITVNCCRDKFRERKRFAEQDPDEAAQRSRPMRSGGEGLLDLDRAIAELPDGYREVLVLHDVEGFTHAEISERLGIDTGTSKSQLSRARARVRRQLGMVRR